MDFHSKYKNKMPIEVQSEMINSLFIDVYGEDNIYKGVNECFLDIFHAMFVKIIVLEHEINMLKKECDKK